MENNKNNWLNYLLHLADTSLILGQRLCEWCGKGPVLEQDIALSNIALDLLGESSNYYQYAAEIQNEGKTEDDLAFLRNERDFKNLLLVEKENGHFGDTIARQFFFDAYHHLLLTELKTSFSHSSVDEAKGLSMRTWIPLSRKNFASSKWLSVEELMTTASIFSLSSSRDSYSFTRYSSLKAFLVSGVLA